MIQITKEGSRSGSVYSFGYDYARLVPPILLIEPGDGGVPVMENIVAVTKEIEQHMGKSIRFFPVAVVTGGSHFIPTEMHQVVYSDDRAEDFTAQCKEVAYDQRGFSRIITEEWCNAYLRDPSPQEIWIGLSPEMQAVAGKLTKSATKYFRCWEDHCKLSDGIDNQYRISPLPTSLVETFNMAFELLRTIFYASVIECQEAVKAMPKHMDGYCGHQEEYLLAFLHSLREVQGIPTILVDWGTMLGYDPGVVEVYKDGICPPPGVRMEFTLPKK